MKRLLFNRELNFSKINNMYSENGQFTETAHIITFS